MAENPLVGGDSDQSLEARLLCSGWQIEGSSVGYVSQSPNSRPMNPLCQSSDDWMTSS